MRQAKLARLTSFARLDKTVRISNPVFRLARLGKNFPPKRLIKSKNPASRIWREFEQPFGSGLRRTRSRGDASPGRACFLYEIERLSSERASELVRAQEWAIGSVRSHKCLAQSCPNAARLAFAQVGARALARWRNSIASWSSCALSPARHKRPRPRPASEPCSWRWRIGSAGRKERPGDGARAKVVARSKARLEEDERQRRRRRKTRGINRWRRRRKT